MKNCGNVLIPCYPSDVIYDLFECITMYLERNGLGSFPIYFISPVAENSLAYSNILAEWLSDNKQSRVYIPEGLFPHPPTVPIGTKLFALHSPPTVEPFPHAQYVRSGRIKHFSSLSDEAFNSEYRTPCVVFTGHPSLRFGDAVHLIQMWGASANNLILFTGNGCHYLHCTSIQLHNLFFVLFSLVEPDFPYVEALAPYQPLAMKAIYCPIDTGFNFIQANKVIRDLNPANLLLPHNYTSGSISGRNPEFAIEADCKMYPYKRRDEIKLPIQCKYERLYIDSEVGWLFCHFWNVNFNGLNFSFTSSRHKSIRWRFTLASVCRQSPEFSKQKTTNFASVRLQKAFNQSC